MKFFLDENFPRTALAQLESSGHSATHAFAVFPPGTSDEQLFSHAQVESAIFLSTDKDFFHTVPLSFTQHFGAIVITLRRPNRADLLRRLAEALTLLGRSHFNQYGLVG